MLFVFNFNSGRNDRQNNNDIRQQPMVTRIPSRRQPTRSKSDFKLNGNKTDCFPWYMYYFMEYSIRNLGFQTTLPLPKCKNLISFWHLKLYWHMYWLQGERLALTTVLSMIQLSPELWPLNQSKGTNQFFTNFHNHNFRFKLFWLAFYKIELWLQ